MEEIKENKKSKEIDIWALVQKIFKEKKLLAIFLGVSFVLGVIVAFNTPKYYTTEVILAPEMSSGGLGLSDNLADMASSFGIDLDSKSGMDAIYPELYPDIFASTDFIVGLFDVPVVLQYDNTPRTYKQHLMKDLSHPFWDYPKIWFAQYRRKFRKPDSAGSAAGEVNPLLLPRDDYELSLGISKSITCLVDKKTSEITITITDQDPLVTAIMADTLQHRLQAYITEYRTRKARIDLEYYEKMSQQSKVEYEKIAEQYGNFGDSHRNSLLTSTSAKEENLLEDMQNAYSFYSTMCKMRDQAKAKIQERTPAFTIIQSAKMPFKPSSRPRIMTVAMFLVIGFICDALYVLYRKPKSNKSIE